MSKLSNELLMLKILMNHKKYTIEELSTMLEVSPRMVRVYKDDLEKSGIFIESIKGKSGGYILYDTSNLPNIRVSKYDLELLKIIRDKDTDELEKSKLKELIDKLEYNSYYFEKFINITNDDKDILKEINTINDCCSSRTKMRIDYESLDKSIKRRVIHPISILFYKEDDYVIAAYCELRGEVRLFNLNRIKNIKVLKDNF